MRILVIGSGGREHALCWAIAKSPRCEKLFVAPGNGGTGTIAENVPLVMDAEVSTSTRVFPENVGTFWVERSNACSRA